jgi:hypothetical protein
MFFSPSLPPKYIAARKAQARASFISQAWVIETLAESKSFCPS